MGEHAPLLEVRDLVTAFEGEGTKVVAVNGLSFSLDRGETLGIVGESGSGKSVTQLSILGLLPTPPASVERGEALFDGHDLLSMSAEELRVLRGNRIAMIFQDPMTSLNPLLRISTQLTEVLAVHSDLGPAQRRARAVEVLQKVGISDAHDRIDCYPHEFSGGMRQRVMIAMALLCNPELLIADEPTTALDVTIQAQILDLLKSLRDDFGTAIILITHDLGVVAGMAERILVMYAGRAMEIGDSMSVFHHPAHPYTRGLLESIPRLDGAQDELIPIDGQPPDLALPLPGCPFAARCGLATEVCSTSFPDPVTLAPGHVAFCHHAEPT